MLNRNQRYGAKGSVEETLALDSSLLRELVRQGGPWKLPTGTDDEEARPSLPLAQTECLVPMLGRDNRLIGALALGPRLSEESYSVEDKQLLALVASLAGAALENIRLAELMAEHIEAERRAAEERVEAERRAACEMEIAKQVQARFFPQKLPPLRTLDYAGKCIQARLVGGDYYDFLDLGPGRMGIVQADIAGKGISGALLMANLQANLRSQYAIALNGLGQLLSSVNHLFRENTADDGYATLFFGDYEDSTRRMRYANCGHNPPYVVRSNGAVERLIATATVLGLFADWNCTVGEVVLAPGDVLVIYTDGVTEATNDLGEEFGQEHLLQTIQAGRQARPSDLVETILAAVRTFSGSAQADDVTLVVACAH
jgi:serine phosphatase RsbU (regulator of sigma subunit)